MIEFKVSSLYNLLSLRLPFFQHINTLRWPLRPLSLLFSLVWVALYKPCNLFNCRMTNDDNTEGKTTLKIALTMGILVSLLIVFIIIVLVWKRKKKNFCGKKSTKNSKFLAHLSWKLKWAFLITCSLCRLSVCPSICPSIYNLFTFSSSPEPLGQFQPNLANCILGWRGYKFVQMKDPAFFQGEIITK